MNKSPEEAAVGLGLSEPRKQLSSPEGGHVGPENSRMATVTGTQPFQASLMNSGHQQDQGME